ncbi:poly(A) RNA polymerase gld-2 homolog A-like isoform X1 [Varroa destructor]|uniref:PAP-associated domain-containing protein n=1 Tax=Varroa destructor TaxID=109461 RepID=A0A7M7KR12_VARDE|nr:poly(A) RNA polymerase gld-2 homolog A-like isoform X1 [Varroa destructor]
MSLSQFCSDAMVLTLLTRTFSAPVNPMTTFKFRIATSQWRNTVDFVQGVRCYYPSSSELTQSSQQLQKNKFNNLPHKQKDRRYEKQTHLRISADNEPLIRKVFNTSQTRISDGLESLVSWQAGVNISNLALFSGSVQGSSMRVLQEPFPESVGNFSRPQVSLRRHNLFSGLLTRRESWTSFLPFVGSHLRRGYVTSKALGKVSPNGTAASTPRKHVPWAPEMTLRLHPKYRGSDPISEMMCWIWDKKRQSKLRYDHKVALRDQLALYVFEEYNLTIIGSSASGYGFEDSDIDICLQFKNNFLPIDYNRVKVLRVLKQRLDGEPGVKKVSMIPAIVPILQFQYQCDKSRPKMRVELNMENTVGIINTQLLYSYSRMDCRVAPFILSVKRWASNMQIKSAQFGTLSSYSLTLLMLYFLQMQGIVPVLHNEVPEFFEGRGFANNAALLLPVWESKNELTLGELFKQMLEFYSDFDFENSCVSVRNGAVISKDDAIEKDPDIIQTSRSRNTTTSSRDWWKFILVQEPFNFTNTARSVYEKRKFQEIKSVFQRSLQVIDRPGGPKVLLF